MKSKTGLEKTKVPQGCKWNSCGAWRRGREIYVCFVDYEKAFDRVNWTKLTRALRIMWIDNWDKTPRKIQHEPFNIQVNGRRLLAWNTEKRSKTTMSFLIAAIQRLNIRTYKKSFWGNRRWSSCWREKDTGIRHLWQTQKMDCSGCGL